MNTIMVDIHWRKSSYSTAQSNCVEVGDLRDGRYGIRDSQYPELVTLQFPTQEWGAFITDAKRGD